MFEENEIELSFIELSDTYTDDIDFDKTLENDVAISDVEENNRGILPEVIEFSDDEDDLNLFNNDASFDDFNYSYDLFSDSENSFSFGDSSINGDFIFEISSTTQVKPSDDKVIGEFLEGEVTDNIKEENVKEESNQKNFTESDTPVPSDTQQQHADKKNFIASYFEKRKKKKEAQLAHELELEDNLTKYSEQISDIKANLRKLKGKKPHSKVFNILFGSAKKIATVAAILTVICSVGYMTYNFNQESQNIVKGFENKGAIYWLNNFVNHNYELCDSLISDESDKIMTFDRTFYFSDDTYYKYLVDSLANSISDIDVLSYQTSESETSYTIRVSYNKFEDITQLKASEAVVTSFKEIKSDYKKGKLTLEQAQQKYEQLHQQIFIENCLKKSSEKAFIELTLVETRDKNGRVYVTGTHEFINDLVSDSHAKHNIGVFQQKIADFTESMIK